VLLITSGIVFPSTQLVPDAITNNGISVLPFYAGNSGGLAVAGRF
jgi:glutamate dehydrogenase/leucine dehydrogenase